MALLNIQAFIYFHLKFSLMFWSQYYFFFRPHNFLSMVKKKHINSLKNNDNVVA